MTGNIPSIQDVRYIAGNISCIYRYSKPPAWHYNTKQKKKKTCRQTDSVLKTRLVSFFSAYCCSFVSFTRLLAGADCIDNAVSGLVFYIVRYRALCTSFSNESWNQAQRTSLTGARDVRET